MPVRTYITSAEHSGAGAQSAVRVPGAMWALCRNTKDLIGRGTWDDFPQPLLASPVVTELWLQNLLFANPSSVKPICKMPELTNGRELEH